MTLKIEEWAQSALRWTSQSLTLLDLQRIETSNQALFRMAIGSALGIGTYIGTLALPVNQVEKRPWMNLAAASTMLYFSVTSYRPLRDRRVAEIGWEAQSSALVNGQEFLTRQVLEHPPREVYRMPETDVAAEAGVPEPQVENVAQTVARSKLPVLVIGGTGVGKTSFLERVIYEAHKEFPQARIIFFDGKPVDNRPMLGIKTQRGRLYYSVAHYSEIPKFYEDMDKIGSQMADARRSQKSQKMFAIVDELNNAITKAKKYRLHEASKPQKERDSFNYEQGLKIGNDLIISQGREKNCVGIATTHSATVEAMGQDMAMRSNQGFVVLAAPESFDNLEIILSGVGAKLIQNPRTLERLNQQYEAHKNLLLQGYFALTNVGGDWRLVRLPDYSQPLPMIWGGSQEQVEEDDLDEPEDTPLPYTEPQQSFPKDWLDAPLREEERDRVGYLWYQRQVQNKAEIALRVRGVAKGKSRYYQQAIDRIEEILR